MSNKGKTAREMNVNLSAWKQMAHKIIRLKLSLLLLFSAFMWINPGKAAHAEPTTSSLDNWYIRSTGQTMVGVTYGNGMYVAVGTSGTILTSSDGVNWMPRKSGITNALYGVSYFNGTYVAVGAAGIILTSSDGVSWMPRTSSTTYDLRTVNYSNGAFVAVGQNGTILTSNDGMSWTSRSSGTTQYLYAVSYFNGNYIVVGAVGTILISSDGATWTSRASGTTNGLYGVSYSNGTYVVVGQSGKVFTSSDGVNWMPRTSITTNGLNGLTYSNGTYVAVGISGTIITSSDGVNWMAGTSGTTNNFAGISYVNGKFVASGNGGTILTSSDGANWTSSLMGVTSNPIYNIIYANGTYMAVEYNGRILTSSDGASWTSRSSGTTFPLYGVIYGNGTYVAVGYGGRIYTSSDGANWTSQLSGTGNHLYSVSYASGTYVAVGASGTIVTSSDGVNWTGSTSGIAYDLWNITFSNGIYVAVGANGMILTSIDGTSWTSQTSGTTNILYGIGYGNSKYVAVGAGGTIVTSSDGASWTSQTSSTSNELRGVGYGNGTYVVVGLGGTILSSSDVTSWADRSSGTSNGLYGVTFANGKYVVAGASGMILQSPIVDALTNAATPGIDTQPTGATVNEGDSSPTLSVAASVSDGGLLTYQWYSNTTNSTSGGTAISSATSSIYAAPTATPGTTYYYVVVTNTNDNASGTKTATATSSVAAVTVNALTNAATPGIDTQPTGAAVNEGDSSPTLSVAASVSDGGLLTYQWYSNTTNSTSGGIAISSATSGAYAAPTATVGTTYYYVVVTNTNNSVSGTKTATATSSIAAVTVNALTNAATPGIDTQPTGATVNEGDSSPALSVAASVSDGGLLTYQWYSNTTNSTSGGTAISIATSPTYAAPTATPGTTYYYVVVTNTNNSVSGTKTATATSSVAAVTVNALTNAASPGIDTQPTGAAVNEGDSSPTLSVAASVSDGGLLSYQWYSNTTNSTSGGTAISSATSPTYAAPTATVGTTYYYVVVINTNNSVSGTKTATATSSIAAVTVNTLTNAATPGIDTQPTGATVNEGDSSPTLSVAASVSDGGLLTYQWYSNKTNSTSGGTAISSATSPTYAAPTATVGTTYYYVVVTNTNSSVSGTKTATATSSVAAVTVNIAPTYTIAAITNQTLTELTQGYISGTQETKTIDITNTGTSDLLNLSAAVSGDHANDFVITQPSETLMSGAAATSFTVKAKDGLPASTYTATVTLSATHMTDVTFTVTQAVNLLNSPANPQNLVATGGDRNITLNWSTVTGATYYNIYMATVSGQFSNASVATVTSSTYNVQNLLNGTTYYFTVKAGNSGGLSGESNQANATPATPATVPAAPTNVSAVAGNGEATVSFTAPTDNGGSAITGYEVTASSGNITVTGQSSPIVITGLVNGTSYTFTVKAISDVGKSVPSAESNTVIPQTSSRDDRDSDTPYAPNTPTTPENKVTNVDILINGKVENAGTATTTQRNGQSITTVVVDQKKLEDKLALEGQHAVVAIPVNHKSDVVISELNGQMVKNMEDMQADLKIITDRATYTIPAEQININAISEQVGKSVALQDIKVQIEIAVPTTDTVKVVENAAAKGTFTLVAPPLSFTVRGTYGDRSIEVSKFNAYIERSIALPDGIDPSKITTGVVVETDGTVRHVPTKIVVIDGKYYAQINSLTNSTYAIVWHPLEFNDVADHWAKQAVSDMGSRMVIDGTGNGMFSPDREITRAEFAAIIVRGLGLKLENGTSEFSDVKMIDWYSSVVTTAYAYHLIDGFEDGTFRPMDRITREQAMVILSKAMTIASLKAKPSVQSTDVILRTFADMSEVSPWALNSVGDNVQAGLVAGRNGDELAPKDYMTRAEVAAIIQRLLQKSGLI
ncbi:S-layer homology domain-containing protein [Paenibacillus sp. P36]|uniref:S-layer homology domain-containing protein n=1 Tax=Paenibacillus sp. P36 TaxID=3342538 RepID=UPI0038B265F8